MVQKEKSMLGKAKKEKPQKKEELSISSDTNELLEKKPKKTKKHKFFYISFLLILLIIGLLYVGKRFLIVAVVNGKPISRLNLIRELEKQSGKQALENLINKELVYQEAKKQNITVTDEEIQKEIGEFSKIIEARGTSLETILTSQGVSRETLEGNIKLTLILEKILGSELQVDETEVKKYFEDNKKLFGEGANYEDFKNDIILRIKQEKMSEKSNTLMEKLRSQSNINYFVNF